MTHWAEAPSRNRIETGYSTGIGTATRRDNVVPQELELLSQRLMFTPRNKKKVLGPMLSQPIMFLAYFMIYHHPQNTGFS